MNNFHRPSAILLVCLMRYIVEMANNRQVFQESLATLQNSTGEGSSG